MYPRFVSFLAALLLVPQVALAATISVPTDVATIQGAIRIAEPGDTIDIAEGEYEETLRIRRLDNLTLTSEGTVTLSAGKDDRDAIVVRSSDGVKISNFEITTAAYGVRLVRCNGTLIQDNTITGTRAGVLLTLGDGNVLMGNTIEDLTGWKSELGILYGGTALRLHKSTNVVVQDSVISSANEVPVGDGIAAYRADGATFRDNDISGLGRNCIRVQKSTDVQIVGENACSDNLKSGIRVNKSSNVLINGADSSGNARLGIYIRKSTGLTVTNNTADFNDRYGIRVKKSEPLTSVDQLIADGNTASRNGVDYRVDNQSQ